MCYYAYQNRLSVQITFEIYHMKWKLEFVLSDIELPEVDFDQFVLTPVLNHLLHDDFFLFIFIFGF